MTTAIYLCPANTGVQNSTFKAKGIADKMPAKVTDIPVYAYPGSTSPGFDLNLTSLQNFLYAQHNRVGVLFPKTSINIFSKVTNLPGLLFNPPYAIFEFTGLSEDNAQVLTNIGLEIEPSVPGSYGGKPGIADIGTLYALKPFSSRPHPGSATPEGYLAYIFMIKGMALYATASHGMRYQKTAFTFTEPRAEVKDKGDLEVEYVMSKDKIKMSLDAKGVTAIEYSAIHPIAVPIDPSRLFTRGYTTAAAPRLLNVSTGGRFFPYFEGMILPERDMSAIQTFQDLFFGCLFDDISKVPQLMNTIRKGYGNIANKSCGQALSHAYLGIRLSKQGHAAITFIVTRGEYQGFVLEGDFTIALYGQSLAPVTTVEVLGGIDGLNLHEQTLRLIVNLFQSAKRADGSPIYPMSTTDIDTSFKFITVYRRLSIPDFAFNVDFQKTLRGYVNNLEYEERYQPFDYASFVSLLRHFGSADNTFVAEKPLWIRDGCFEHINSRVSEGLAVFGNYCPTINTGNDSDMKFPIPRITAQDPNLVEKDGKRLLRYLPVKKTGLMNAIGHWNRLFDKGVLQIPNAKKGSGRFTPKQGVVFEVAKDDEFSLCYRLIKEHLNSLRDAKGLKRTADAAGAVAGQSGKRAGKGRAVFDFDG